MVPSTELHQRECCLRVCSFTDDHLFVCPRNLCDNYFRLLDMFARADCVAPGHLSALPSNQSSQSAASQLPPDAWVLPRPPSPMSTQWYFFREYGGAEKGCIYSWANSTLCCGHTREFVLFYALAKRDARGAGYLTCDMFWRPNTVIHTNRTQRAQSAALCADWNSRFRDATSLAGNRDL